MSGGGGWIYDLYLAASPGGSSRPTAPEPGPSAPAYVVMGSYLPGDEAGLQARVAQAELAGVPLETGPSERYGMNPGYVVIVSGPYERSRAERVLAQVRPHVLDAFLRAVR